MDYLISNIYIIIAIAAVATVAGVGVTTFLNYPTSKKLSKVKEWLLYAVTEAEKEFGTGTGQIKLRYVYDMFLDKFPWLAEVVKFEQFSQLVDEALDQMRDMLQSNKALKSYVSGETHEA